MHSLHLDSITVMYALWVSLLFRFTIWGEGTGDYCAARVSPDLVVNRGRGGVLCGYCSLSSYLRLPVPDELALKEPRYPHLSDRCYVQLWLRSTRMTRIGSDTPTARG